MGKKDYKKENKPFNLPVCNITASYCNVFENMGEGVSIFEIMYGNMGKISNLRVIYINPASILNKFGSRDEIIGRTIIELCGADKIASYLKMAENVILAGKSVRYEAHFAQFNKYLLINGFSPHKDLCVIIEVNITREKEVEVQLKKQADLLNLTSDAIIVHDMQDRVTFWNHGAEERYGWREEEILGKVTHELLQTEFPDSLEETCEQFLKKGYWEGELTHTKRDGTKIVVSSRWAVQKDENNEPAGFMEINTDITERKKAEKELKESEAKYRTIFENTGIAFAVIEEDTTISLMNTESEGIMGYSKDEIEGKRSWTEFVAKKNDLEKMKEYHRLRRADPDAAPKRYEFQAVSKEGNIKDIIITISMIPGTKKSIASFLDNTEYKKVETALIESETKYRTIFENTGIAFMIIEEDMTISLINEEMEKTFGYLKEEVEGKRKWTEFVATKTDLERMKEYHRIRRENPEVAPKQYDYRAIAKNGDIKDVLVNVSIIPGSKKSIASFIDITGRKKSEKALKESEEKLREAHDKLELKVQERTRELEQSNIQLKQEIYERKRVEKELYQEKVRAQTYLDIAGVVLVAINRDLTISLINRKGIEIVGYDEDEIIGRNFIDFIPEKFRAELTNIATRIISGKLKQFERYEGPILTKSGEERLISWHVAILRDSNGNFINALISGEDITESKKAKEALKESEERFKILFKYAPDPYFLTDMEGNFLDGNRAAERLIGFKRENIIGKNIVGLGLISEDQVPKAFKLLSINVQGVSTGPEEFILTKKDGKKIPVEITGYPIEIRGQKLVLGMARDISERKKAEEKLKETIEELKRSNEELQQFAYITSHDLQEPLRTIASFTQLIERRYKGQMDADADEFIDFIVDAATRMKEMIQGLLDYSRVGTRGGEFDFVNTEEVLTTVLSNLHAAISENKAEITHDELPTVIADKTQLIQLFQNLVSNAIKFKKPDVPPKIHISARKDEWNKEYVFSISDNGIGLELQYKDKIFEVFKRLHAMDEYKGAGIGLAISKRIIERHGGQIWVDSEPRVGSTFYFTFPFNVDLYLEAT